MAESDEVVQRFKSLSSEDQAVVRSQILPPPPEQALGEIWKLLLGGLFVIALLAGFAAFILYAKDNAAAGAFIAVTTTVVGALIGLIAPSPVPAH
jgi:hypothetical protein